jgi:hypothetical protein
VSEAAGPQAALATVAREPVSSRALNVQLASSNTNAALVPFRVTIQPGHSSVSFPIAAVDDAIVDGTELSEITAVLVDAVTGAAFGAPASALLFVTDDDGPALSLSTAKKLVGEGLVPATTAIVSRNTGSSGELTVQLSSSNPAEAVVPASVVISNGQTSAAFPINTIHDGITDGNQRVTIEARAAGFTSASEVLTVTDATLPDLVVSLVEGPATAITESFVSVRYRIVNQGLATAASNWTTRVFLSRDALAGDDILAGQFVFNGAIPVGSFFEQTLAIRMPRSSGSYWLVVQTDVENAVAEGLEDNNAGSVCRPSRFSRLTPQLWPRRWRWRPLAR